MPTLSNTSLNKVEALQDYLRGGQCYNYLERSHIESMAEKTLFNVRGNARQC